MVSRTNQLLDFIRDGNINHESPQCEPSNMKIDLLQHQKSMLAHMISLESGHQKIEDYDVKSTMGVCGDMVGAGKSIEILALICTKPYIDKTEIIYNHGNHIHTTRTLECSKQPTLIVVPHTCMNQWCTYVDEYTHLKHQSVTRRKHIDTFYVKDSELVLCTNKMYNEFAVCNPLQWSRVVFDEADSIDIPRMHTPHAHFVWFVTSSLHNLLFPSGCYYTRNENGSYQRYNIDGVRKTGYIRDTFNNLSYSCSLDVLKSICFKSSDEYVKSSFNLDEPVSTVVRCKTPREVSTLVGIVPDDVVTMLNAGDIDSAIDRIGCSVDTTENIINGVVSSYTETRSNLKTELEAVKQMSYTRQEDRESQKKRIEGLEKKIGEIESKIQCIKDRLTQYNLCSICIDSPCMPTVVQCCQNVFCFECITRSLNTKTRCPMCRTAIGKNQLSIMDEAGPRKATCCEDIKSKEDALIDIIKNKAAGKFLVFSAFDQTFIPILNSLESNHISHARLVGTGSRVNSLIEQYKNRDLNVLMLNASHYGTGLNLENTTDLIFCHKMTHDMEKQVIGRAQRSGRTTQLKIWYLYHDNE